MEENFWESLRQGFMQLRVECAIDPPLSPAGRLTAIWTAQRVDKWRLNYHNGKDGSGVAKRFSWAAESAAAQLGFVGSGNHAVSHWLDQIKSNAPVSHVKVINIADGVGNAEEIYSVEIFDICGLSADYCRKCQADQIRSRMTRSEDSVTSERCRELLRWMVTTHEATGGTEFHLTWNTDGWWVTFPRTNSLAKLIRLGHG